MNWNDIVGQEGAKRRLDFYYKAAIHGDEPLPTFFFCGPRGAGKTEIAKAFGLRVREATKGEKRLFDVNAASIKNLKGFWNSVIIPVVNDRDVTLLIDEASELPTDVTMALLTMLQPNSSGVNQFTYEDMTVEIQRRRQTFIFCTTEPHKVFHALMNRCVRIDLDEYSPPDLMTIIRRNTKGIAFGPKVLPELAQVLRGNARQAVMMAKDVRTYLAPLKRETFAMADWTALKQQLDILPMGLSRLELRVLRTLADRPDCSLTRLAATLCMTPTSVQRDLELFLQSRGYMEVTPQRGRNITARGQEYLRNLDNPKTEVKKK